jgi:histidyl-tRNA synthetase
MVNPRTMPGVLELLPLEQVAFQRMLDTIRRVYERFGFVRIETPSIERTDVLLTKSGGETERQVYFVQSTGSLEQGSDPELALPFDLTVPLARYVAEHEQQLAFPFRRYQIQRVYRGESPQRGRFREFYQADIDVIGRDRLSLRYDAEMPAVIVQVFEELALGDFTVQLNNRRFMRGFLEDLGVDDPEAQAAVLREVDKLDKRDPERVRAAVAGLGLTSDAVDRLFALVETPPASHDDAIDLLDSLGGDHPVLEAGIEELRTVLTAMRSLGVPEHRYVFAPAIARGLDYYTGTVYETRLDAHPEIGSICSGGRYDDLAGLYTSSTLPGVGISIGVTRLFWQLRELGEIGGSATSTVEAYVTVMDEDGVGPGLTLASELRRAGVRTEAAVEAGRLGKQLKYADRAGIRFAIIAGPDERDRGTVTVRDLVDQSQTEMGRDAVVAHLVERTAGDPT